MLPEFAAQFQQLIEAYPSIALFRHVYPDPDALGSQHGLEGWLKKAYPDKKILAASAENEIDPQDLDQTLAIILDTSNRERVDGSSWKDAAKTLRIDHHVLCDAFADVDYVDDKAAATCELVPLILEQLGQSIDAKTAQTLLEGLMADSQRFTISTVRPQTYQAAAWLRSMGADPVQAGLALSLRSYDIFCYGALIRSKARMKEHLLYSVVSMDDYLRFGLDFSSAKNSVDELAHVDSASIWVLFTCMEDGLHYSASLRSSSIPIRDLAAKYGGGGHEMASGIKNLTAAQMTALIEELAERSNSDPKQYD